jgi:TolB-like protein/DNA-binding winged helix-turn-helix (wHTH) protein/Tfp pilus assembly protein PilF
MVHNRKDLYEFGPFRLDTAQRLLLRDNQPIPLQPKAFDTLFVLVHNSERLVPKEELLNTVWPDTFVEESNLTQNIFVLRKALGEADGNRRYIITVPGHGYRFAEKVQIVSEREEVVRGGISGLPEVMKEESSVQRTPRQVPWGGPFRLIAALAGVVILTCGSYGVWRHFHPKKLASGGRIMLAVLPFRNLTGDPEQQFFADGLTEQMITQLGRLNPEQLGVIARTSVMGYQNSDKRLDQIGRELSVQYVLEGSFRRAADRLRITAQLIQVKDQSHLWGQDYDRKPEDVLTVEDEVAVAVAREIQIRLTPHQQIKLARSRTIDFDAYEAYLKGRYFWNKRTEDGFRRAIDYFDQAIAKDPNYAQPYAGLADSYAMLAGYDFMSQDDAMPKARAAAQKALTIDDQLAEAYTALGLISMEYEWNWAQAENDFKQAIGLDPNYSVAHEYYGDGYLALVGKQDESIAELRKAHELDPLSPIIACDLAKRLSEARRYDEAIAQFQKILDLDPDFVQGRYYLALNYADMRRYPDAIAELKKIKSWESLPFIVAKLGEIYALQGKRQEALEIVDRLQQGSAHQYTNPISIVRIYIALGEKDQAFFWLQKAYTAHATPLLSLSTDPVYDPLRSDPRFQEILLKVGLPKVSRQPVAWMQLKPGSKITTPVLG